VNAVSNPLLSYLRTAVPMWVGTIFVAAGAAASFGSVGEWLDARRFARDAVTAQAEVVAKSLERATRDGNSRTRYLVTYRLTARDGAVAEQTEEISVELWEGLAEGGALAVRYLPDDAGTMRAAPAGPVWVGLLIACLTAVFAAIGVVMALPGWRRVRVLLRLQRHGVTAQGTVIEVMPAGIRINKIPQWHLRYEFHDQHGRGQQGVSNYMRAGEAGQWRVGDAGAVRYDRDRPADSAWLGRAS
jgi:hypothetical protein